MTAAELQTTALPESNTSIALSFPEAKQISVPFTAKDVVPLAVDLIQNPEQNRANSPYAKLIERAEHIATNVSTLATEIAAKVDWQAADDSLETTSDSQQLAIMDKAQKLVEASIPNQRRIRGIMGAMVRWGHIRPEDIRYADGSIVASDELKERLSHVKAFQENPLLLEAYQQLHKFGENSKIRKQAAVQVREDVERAKAQREANDEQILEDKAFAFVDRVKAPALAGLSAASAVTMVPQTVTAIESAYHNVTQAIYTPDPGFSEQTDVRVAFAARPALAQNIQIDKLRMIQETPVPATTPELATHPSQTLVVEVKGTPSALEGTLKAMSQVNVSDDELVRETRDRVVSNRGGMRPKDDEEFVDQDKDNQDTMNQIKADAAEQARIRAQQRSEQASAPATATPTTESSQASASITKDTGTVKDPDKPKPTVTPKPAPRISTASNSSLDIHPTIDAKCDKYDSLFARYKDWSGRIMKEIAYHESTCNANATHVNTNGTVDRGLFQINSIWNRLFGGRSPFDPSANTDAAHTIWKQQGYRAWMVYVKGLINGRP